MAAGIRNGYSLSLVQQRNKNLAIAVSSFCYIIIWNWGGRKINDLQHCIAVLPSHLEQSCSFHEIRVGLQINSY